jgi:hypothetical protein
MKQNYFKLLLLLVSPTFITAQNIWGVGSGVDVANAEFSNAFVQATTFTAGNNVNSWTALSVSQAGGSVTPGAAFWARNTTGVSQGGYAAGMTPIASPSAANGAALFDSDYLDNGGVLGNFGFGTSPSAHVGHLISPRMDLTGNTDTPISVRFYSYYRRFNLTELSISFSTDDGTTWGTAVPFQNIPAVNTNISGYETLNLPANATAGISNLTQCRLRFVFNGDYYYSMVDDVTIGTTATLSNSSVDVNLKDFKIYPNPAQNQVTIEANELTNASLQVLDINGRVLKTQKIDKTNNNINIESLQVGVYLFKITSNEGTSTQRVIKN